MPGRPTTTTPVAIIGAGLTGLSASIALREAGIPHRVFERSEQVGGYAVTNTEQGYRFDCTGHLLHLRDPALRDEVFAWLDEEPLEIQRRSSVWSHGTYTRYPFQANTFGLPPQVAYECLLGFVQARSAPTPPTPQNFEEYCLAHFGPGFSRHFMLPYNARLWGIEPRELTAAWCQRFVPVPRLEDVIAGAVGLLDRELGYNQRFYLPRLGIGQLPRAMLKRSGTIELCRAPIRLDTRQRQLVFPDEIVHYGVLVNTAPLPSLLHLTSDLPPEVAAAARRLRATPLYYLDVALDGPCLQDSHWVYVPERKYPFYRVGCYSHFSPEMAPPGKAGLYVELVDRQPPILPELLPSLGQELMQMGLIRSSSDVLFARLRHLDPAYVIYDHSYEPALAAVWPFFAEASIVSTGRYGGWNYSAMEDALQFGREAARKAQSLL